MLLASVSKEELEEIEREVRGKMGADDKNDNERLPDPSTSAAPQMVWEYEDDSGNWQGPFTMEQLQTWRAALPMNLKVRQCGNTNASEYTSLAILLGRAFKKKVRRVRGGFTVKMYGGGSRAGDDGSHRGARSNCERKFERVSQRS